jgi:protein O-GlcNAc transferase
MDARREMNEPNDTTARHLLGLTAYQNGDVVAAEQHLRQVLAQDEGRAIAHHHLGLVLMKQERLDEASAAFARAAALEPEAIEPHIKLGDARHMLHDLDAAQAAYERAAQIDRHHIDLLWGLGCLLGTRGEHAGSAALLHGVIRQAPDWGEAHHNLGKALFDIGLRDEAISAHRHAARLLPSETRPLESLAVIIAGSPCADEQTVADARRAWASRVMPAPMVRAPRASSPVESGATRPLRVGYLSAFFAQRNWMKPVWGLINHHDRGRIEVHLFGDGRKPGLEDGYRADARDCFHDLTGRSNDEAASLIDKADLDLLVDLNAYSFPSRLPLLALRPAPMVIAWFNLFAPSGLEAYDYVIGDRHVLPASDRGVWRERVVRLRGSYLTFDVAYSTPDVATPPCISRSHITFGALCPQYKITPEVVAVWARILNGAPGARLLIRSIAMGAAGNRRFLTEQFEAHGIAADRLDLLGPAEHYVFLETYGEVDVALDPFPYNGGTTTMEALWQGVPVLTFSGDRWAARIGASLLCNAELSEFVAANVDEHIAMAIALATDPGTPARLAELRRTMRDRLRRAPVCDVRRFARDMERIYTRMHRMRALSPTA